MDMISTTALVTLLILVGTIFLGALIYSLQQPYKRDDGSFH